MKYTVPPFRLALLAGGLSLASLPAAAQDMYISGSLGLTFQEDPYNQGAFVFLDDNATNPAFVTGEVTGVSPPLEIDAGTPIGWRTEFDDALYYNFALGWDIDILRMELEYSRTKPDVDTHRGVTVGELDLSDIDAGVLITDNVGDLGVSVADLVADAQGSVDSMAVMLNFLYDFDLDLPVTPYAGIGLGMADTDFTYNPSDVEIIRSGDNSFAWQLMVGATYEINDMFDVYANYRYRDHGEPDINATLFPVEFDIENKSQVLDLGIRYKF